MMFGEVGSNENIRGIVWIKTRAFVKVKRVNKERDEENE